MKLNELIESLKRIKKSNPWTADLEVRVSGMYGAQTNTIDEIELIPGELHDVAHININTDLMTG